MAISKIVQNSISDTVQLGRDFVFKPTITSPANNTTNVSFDQLITATSYLSLYGIAQANALFQISTSPTFAFINVESTITGSNTQFQANIDSGLVASTTTHYARVRYSDTSNNSSAFSDTVEFTTAASFDFLVDFLVVAGGGGTASAEGNLGAMGGSGAGGLIEASSYSLSPKTSYTLTIGAGGAASGSVTLPGINGSNSVFAEVTAFGGGHGPDYNTAGGNGGSGGGGSEDNKLGGSATQTSGLGYTGYGNAGGAGGPYTTGGGGGGGGAGGAGQAFNAGRAGGVGRTNSITGSAVTYAAGGAGCPPSTFRNSTAGAANRGNGATGAGASGSEGVGANGGSGVVIVKYPDKFTITNPGGGLTSSTASAGGFKVTTFTAGTGNIQFA